jgi:16S rRNA (adenine1518-N6/adenine1519-N6)-dimethyltransferase
MEIVSLLRGMGGHPNKRLGQHFLVDPDVLATLIKEVSRYRPRNLLEIGAGSGTTQLASIAERVVAVELDARFIPVLKQMTEHKRNVEIHHGDFLSFNIGQVFENGTVLVVGNLPYQITAPILKHLVIHRRVISRVLLITQREVAEKIVSSPGADGSALGVLVRAYADVSLIRQISKRAFYPVPKVDSALWTFSFLDRPRFSADPATFFGMVRLLYGKRRKMIRRVLRDLLPEDRIMALLAAAEIDPTVRAETLGFEALDRLACEAGRIGLSPLPHKVDNSP